MRVLVVTCAHRGDDARIVHRQAAALLAAGHDVTLIAPTIGVDVSADPDGLRRVDVTRATGRRRLSAWRATRRAVDARLADPATSPDVIVLHDPELVLVARGAWMRRGAVVWDMHEDYAASITDRGWIPAPARRAIAAAVRLLHRRARHTMYVTLAEHSYRAFFPDAPVVPNSTWVPDPRPDVAVRAPAEAVYVGRVSAARGAAEMVELGRRLQGVARVVVVGPADGDVRDLMQAAHDDGSIEWTGPLPNPEALTRVRGALVGLSLLHDEPNYRHSMPTKLVEYMAQGVPVISTPLAVAVELVEASGGGTVVPFGDVDEAAAAITALIAEPDRRERLASAGHQFVAAHHNWTVDGERFAEQLSAWAVRGPHRT